MQMYFRRIPFWPLAALVLVMALAVPPRAHAGLEDGVAAYGAGDFQTAVAALRPLAEDGNPEAQYYLGQMYRTGRGGLPRDGSEAVAWYARAAAQGVVSAQYNLGQMYRTGQGVPADVHRAARWYRLAAEQGHPRAQDHLGLMYAAGQGVRRDLAEAYAWVALAAGRLDGRAEIHRRELLARMDPIELKSARKRAIAYAERYGGPSGGPGDAAP